MDTMHIRIEPAHKDTMTELSRMKGSTLATWVRTTLIAAMKSDSEYSTAKRIADNKKLQKDVGGIKEEAF